MSEEKKSLEDDVSKKEESERKKIEAPQNPGVEGESFATPIVGFVVGVVLGLVIDKLVLGVAIGLCFASIAAIMKKSS
ncbi:MAG: hypothetical protein RR177_01235 [Oscillospiraceae bacterium]